MASDDDEGECSPSENAKGRIQVHQEPDSDGTFWKAVAANDNPIRVLRRKIKALEKCLEYKRVTLAKMEEMLLVPLKEEVSSHPSCLTPTKPKGMGLLSPEKE